MSSRPHIDALRAQIRQVRVKSVDRRNFVPETVLLDIFTPEAIAAAVTELGCSPEDELGLSDAIRSRGITTFAILVWMHQESAIVNFRRWDCIDSKYLNEELALAIAPNFGSEFVNEYSWQFRPHFFHRGECLQIDERKVLPFVSEQEFSDEGGFGNISKVEIHHALHDFYPASDRSALVVRKALRRQGPEDRRQKLFRNEWRSLLLLDSRKHANIIPFFGAYQQGSQLCFLFPALDMDLRSYFAREKAYGDFQWDFTFVAALKGLASALSCVHNVRLRRDIEGVDFLGHGYHHDLRPANVLVTRSTFVLADFGLGSIKPSEESSRTPWKAGIGDYIAPECMNEDLMHKDVGRAIDVWAFGCLIAEVFSFMCLGSKGLKDFRDLRLESDPSPNWKTSYFYDSGGEVRSCVWQWMNNHFHSHDYEWAARLVQMILLPASERPKIEDILHLLSLVNVWAHLIAVHECLNRILETYNPSTSTITVPYSKLWVQRERLKAFGKVLALDPFDLDSPNLLINELASDGYVGVLKELFAQLQVLENIEVSSPATTHSSTDEAQQVGVQALFEQENTILHAVEDFGADIQAAVQKLWDLLPRELVKKAHQAWVEAMLRTDQVDGLSGVAESLSFDEVSMSVAGMAMMKRLRLEFSSGTAPSSEYDDMIKNQDDVGTPTSVQGHYMSVFQKTQAIIVEWMHYTREWEQIPPNERALTMALKAKAFGLHPKPEALRTLNCLGFFENADGRGPGYGFMYEIPGVGQQITMSSPPLVTLQTLLRRSASAHRHPSRPDLHLSKPLLGDKYRLAYMLSEFLLVFHTIGWLHENLHSNNIVFFQHLEDNECIAPSNSGLITLPYILGLHKSRPGGDAWHTQGPPLESAFPDYVDPDYEVTRRFRRSYDYYSLGLVLLEIGLWIPLAAVSQRNQGTTGNKLRNTLISIYVPRLGPNMGMVYQNVVEKLLASGLDSSPKQRLPSSENEQSVFDRFSEEVYGPLSRLADMPL